MRGSKRPNGNGDGFKSETGIRCAIYTRKSTDEGLDSDFNTLDAQRELAEACIVSQRLEGWLTLPQKGPRTALRGLSTWCPNTFSTSPGGNIFFAAITTPF